MIAVTTSAIGGQPGTLISGLSVITGVPALPVLGWVSPLGRSPMKHMSASKNGLGVFGRVAQLIDKRLAANDAKHAIFVEWRIALNGDDIIAFVLFDHLVDDRFGL